MEGKFTDVSVDMSIIDGVLTSYNSDFKVVDIPSSVNRIADNVFMDKDIDGVLFNEGLTHIGIGAFRNCRDLKSIKIPHGVVEIADFAFSGCELLKYIILPETLEVIGEGALPLDNEGVVIVAKYGTYAYEYAVENKVPLCESEEILERIVDFIRRAESSVSFYEFDIFGELVRVPSTCPTSDGVFEHYNIVRADFCKYILELRDSITEHFLDKLVSDYVIDIETRAKKIGVAVSPYELENRIGRYAEKIKNEFFEYRKSFYKAKNNQKKDELTRAFLSLVESFVDRLEEAEINCLVRQGLADRESLRTLSYKRREAMSIANEIMANGKSDKEMIIKALKIYPYNPSLIRYAVAREVVPFGIIDIVGAFRLNIVGGRIYNILDTNDFSKIFDVQEYVEKAFNEFISDNTWAQFTSRGVSPAPFAQLDFSACQTRGEAMAQVIDVLKKRMGEQERLYNEALALERSAKNNKQRKEAIVAFSKIKDIGDSRIKIAELERKNKNKITAIVVSVALAIVVMLISAVLIYMYKKETTPVLEDRGDYYAIVGYRGAGSSIEIPTEKDGKPVSEIVDEAFFECNNIKDLIIPESITKIGVSAFENCKNLESVEIKGDVVGLSTKLFSGCENLKSVKLSEWVEHIGDMAFSECESLEFIEIPEGISSIGNEAFRSCESLSSITIPTSVVTIGNYAFAFCSNLSSVTILGDIDKIGSWAFSSCENLKTLNIQGRVNEVGEGAFLYSPIEEAVAPVNAIGSLSYLKRLTLVKTTTMTNEAFNGLGALEYVSIPAGVNQIEDMVFAGSGNLATIVVDEGNEYYKSVDNILYTKDGSTLLRYAPASSRENFVIPDNVTTISYYAFAYAKNLASITIGEGVASIGMSAFSECTRLQRVTIPDNVSWLGHNAFSGCTNLERVELSIGISAILSGLFEGCTKLTYVEIPDSITYIGNDAFADCKSLMRIEIPNGVSEIQRSAFSGCVKLTEIILPTSITEIENNVFENCTALQRVVYLGNEDMWNRILVGEENEMLFEKISFTE